MSKQSPGLLAAPEGGVSSPDSGGRVTLRFIAPLPYRALSQNWRGHRLADAAAVRQYRATLRYLTLEALGRERPRGGWLGQISHVRMSLEFRLRGPAKGSRANGVEMRPDWQKPYRPRDVLNAAGSFKAGEDGIADALGIGDDWKHWSLGEVTICDRHPDGEGVAVTLALTSAGLEGTDG